MFMYMYMYACTVTVTVVNMYAFNGYFFAPCRQGYVRPPRRRACGIAAMRAPSAAALHSSRAKLDKVRAHLNAVDVVES